MKTLLVIVLLTFANSFLIADQDGTVNNVPLTNGQNLLTFTNTKGAQITDDQLSSFKNLAVNASKIFGTNGLDNVKFITNQMNSTYPLSFNVFLQTSTDIYSTYKIASTYYENYASFGPGVNSVQPQWSYLMFVSRQFVTPLSYVYIDGLGKGTGYTIDQVADITRAVSSADGPDGNCYCVSSFFDTLVQSISKVANNIICQSKVPTISSFQVMNDRWLVIKPRNCYYTIWTNA